MAVVVCDQSIAKKAQSKDEQVFTRDSIQIIDRSSTGKTIIIDLGYNEGLRLGQEAKFVKQYFVQYPKLFFVAQGRVVKVHSTYSYWLLSKVEYPDLIARGERLLVFPLELALRGRRPIRLGKKKVILLDQERINQTREDDKTGVPYDLIYENIDEHYPGEKIVGTDVTKWYDLETTEYDVWSEYYEDGPPEETSERKKYVVDMDDMVDSKKVRREIHKEIFDSMVDENILKINLLEGGLDELYEDQRTDPDIKLLSHKISTPNVYEKTKDKEIESTLVSTASLNRIKSGDPRWSEEMSDEQLRRLFIKTGIALERERRHFALNNRVTNEILFSYYKGLAYKTSENDSNFQSPGWAMSIGYEYYLMRTSRTLDAWTLQLFIEKDVNFYDVGDINARSIENNYKAVLNWYVFNYPSSVSSYLIYLGGGVKFGSSKLESTQFARAYEYDVRSLPYWHIGMKYRFKAGDELGNIARFGISANLFLAYDYLKVTSDDQLEDNIKGSLIVSDLKLAFGIGLYF